MSPLRSAAFVLSVLFAASAHAALPPGITGAWYNPEQSGHGLSVEIIAPDHALVIWHAFDTRGRPLTLYMDGPITGRRIDATVYAPQGMRFGDFDRAELQMPVWGEIEIEFSDCEAGELRWRALDSAFGSGSTRLQRLTSVSGLECEFSEQPAAVFSARVQRPATGVQGSGYAAMDETGRLWAVETLAVGLPDSLPVFAYVGQGQALLQARARPGRAAEVRRYAPDASPTFQADMQVDAGGGNLSLKLFAGRDEIWSFEPSSATLTAPLRAADLARSWTVHGRSQFFDHTLQLHIEPDGSFCYDYGSPCALRGRLDFHRAQAGFFDFTIEDLEGSTDPDTRGRGWLQGSGANQRLIMIGEDGTGGRLALIGR